ncbi:MAG TPA: hypothetical protein DC046_00940 [Rhodospirillaceae bacterium]|nr:hypothetical protein [Rhodospirillaceae bacterium]
MPLVHGAIQSHMESYSAANDAAPPGGAPPSPARQLPKMELKRPAPPPPGASLLPGPVDGRSGFLLTQIVVGNLRLPRDLRSPIRSILFAELEWKIINYQNWRMLA